MHLDIISYNDLLQSDPKALTQLEAALLTKGIVGIRGVPDFEKRMRAYIDAVRRFTQLSETVKQQYAPNRDKGETEGYELGAEWFQNDQGEWQRDDRKASFYAFVPEDPRNKWPQDVDLKTPYLELGELIFNTGKHILKVLGLDESIGLYHDRLVGYGRMLHYKSSESQREEGSWCGAHLDHGILTGLIPAHYFKGDQEVDEPEEAGLYVIPHNGNDFVKMSAKDKSVLLFQVGEFGQLMSNDRIRATKHVVKQTKQALDRFTFALFYSAEGSYAITSRSELISDSRYAANAEDGSITYQQWEAASYEKYRAR